MNNFRERVVAAFLGTAIGDALGAPLEGISWKKRKEIGRVENYITNDDRSWNGRLLRGQWTDDTQLTLVVAESLIANGGRINMDDMAARHVAALTEAREKGWNWGRTTTLAVEQLEAGVHWNESGKNLGDGCGAGNGIAMKIVPISVLLVAKSSIGSWTYEDVFSFATMTHATGAGIAAGFAQAGALKICFESRSGSSFCVRTFSRRLSEMALRGYGFATKLGFPSADFESLRFRLDVCLPRSDTLNRESIARVFGIQGFHVADSLPATWAFFLRNPYNICTLYDVVNAGGDTDSNGAMVGALLGALNGTRIFPQHLIDGLWQKERIVDTANQLCDVLGIE